ncbi:MAG: type II secretion system GspH family protein [Fusobacterium sp.]|nr:type II secretion system GspH family protein [Fusobacterium sp.]
MKNKIMYMLTGGGGSSLTGFTMAEILLSLTIIGVVAAITLPSLTGNINERTWNTQRKALYARFSQAIALMPALNGFGTLTEDASGSVTQDNAAETFVTAGLSKVLKINNICDSENLADCGMPETIIPLSNGSKIDLPKTLNELNPQLTSINYSRTDSIEKTYKHSAINTKAVAFETANGESIAVYYNPACTSDMNETNEIMVPTKICAHFIYDLNGSKGPNTVNKDIGFITVLFPSDSVVVSPINYPQRHSGLVAYTDAAKTCTKTDPEYRVPNRYELMSMLASKRLLGLVDGAYNSSSLDSAGKVWRIWFQAGMLEVTTKDNEYSLWCVKR